MGQSGGLGPSSSDGGGKLVAGSSPSGTAPSSDISGISRSYGGGGGGGMCPDISNSGSSRLGAAGGGTNSGGRGANYKIAVDGTSSISGASSGQDGIANSGGGGGGGSACNAFGDMAVGRDGYVQRTDGGTGGSGVIIIRYFNVYSVIWDNQSATSTHTGGSQTYVAGSSILQIPTVDPSRTGYTFMGWFTSSTGGSEVFDASFTPTSPFGSTTLYAQWSCDQTRILRYFANRSTSGTLPVSGNQSVCQSESITLAANIGNLARTGFTFSGWSTSELGSGTNYATGAAFTVPSKNTALYALWIPTNTKTQLIYDGNRHDSGSAPTLSEQTPSTSIIVAGNTGSLAKTGKCFGGWNTKPNGSGTTYAAGSSYTHTKTKKVVLYALWKNTGTC
jgi:uncharacterized repeat protein (TIGR02543 family)